MKKTILLYILLLVSSGILAQHDTTSVKNKTTGTESLLSNDSLTTKHFIPLADAQQILGQPVHLHDSLHRLSQGYLRYQFTFRTNTFDSITCETATLYFSFEQYPKDDGAAHSFDYIKTENKKTSTVTDITDVGNEGFVAKDAMNYPFIMIRNKTRLFKLKMRHHISTSSYNTMLALMKKIVANN